MALFPHSLLRLPYSPLHPQLHVYSHREVAVAVAVAAVAAAAVVLAFSCVAMAEITLRGLAAAAGHSMTLVVALLLSAATVPIRAARAHLPEDADAARIAGPREVHPP